jgi:multiple sugar transport system permease protein
MAITRSRHGRIQHLLGRIGLYFSVAVLVSPALFVFLWMLSLSLKTEISNMAFPPVFVPNPPTLGNFAEVLTDSDFLLDLRNSVITTFSAVLLGLLVGVPAGYGLAKTRSTKSLTLILVARMTPALSYLIPLYLLYRALGLLGTLVPLVITNLVLTVPMVIWVLVGFFESLPGELEDAALVDGANLWQAFYLVALPLARPGVVVAFILSFILSWNNFIFGVVLGGRGTTTLPVEVYNAMSFSQLNWGHLAAVALLVTAPVLLVTILMQKQIVTGLTAGGVKSG